MTARELKIARKVLDYLHGLDGGQADELVIHAEIGGLVVASVNELTEVLSQLNEQRLIRGIMPKLYKRLKWSITDLGESARLDLAN